MSFLIGDIMGFAKILRRTFLGVVLVGAGYTYTCGSTYIPPGSQGVRELKQQMPWRAAGYFPETLQPGRHFKIPFIEKIHKLPAEQQVLEFVGASEASARDYARNVDHADVVPAQQIETSDGFNVHVDLSIFYRISDPFKLLSEYGPGNLYFLNGLLTEAPASLKATFGKLQPEEFFTLDEEEMPIRVKSQEEAVTDLTTRLADGGLEVQEVRIRYVTFEEKIQGRFELTKVADQETLTEQSRTLREQANAELQRLIEEGQQAVAVLQKEGEAYVTVREGARQAYERSRGSEATMIIDVAEAERTRLVNAAYEGQGSELLVAQQMADSVLSNLPFLIWQPGPSNPLDLANLLRMISGGGSR
jgi:regulator of protease activity HflC (stomatin/prohibitin superfamily)